MIGELEPIEVVRQLGGLAAPGRSDVLIHNFEGRRVPRARCELCGVAYENGISRAWERGDSDALPPMVHHAYPPSMNEGGSGYNRDLYRRSKQAWEQVFARMLFAAEVPQPLARVVVEGEWTFPQRYGQGPDQDNYRYPCSKFLGDALQLGGWLPNDWWAAYEFGGATYNLERGVRRLRLMIFPTLAQTLEMAA